MNYKLYIEKKEPNPNFDKEYGEWKERQRYVGYERGDIPAAEWTRNALICELTEEQFKAIKAEVFKVFE